MEKVGKLLKWFLYITPGIVFVYAVNIEIAGEETIPARGLWQVLLAGFLTALVTMALVPREGKRKWSVFAGILLHYAVLCVVMIACGCLFGWMDFDASGVIMMSVSVAAVYLLSFLVYFRIDLKQAEEINRKLKEKYGDEES